MRTRFAVWLLAAVLCAGCGHHVVASKPPLTERQRDSVIGASKLPGAAGVRGALRAVDSSTARNARYDSIGHAP
ncbi:MAG: hypothetical protein ACREL5_10210 [Gemmatimonadales bacterium]